MTTSEITLDEALQIAAYLRRWSGSAPEPATAEDRKHHTVHQAVLVLAAEVERLREACEQEATERAHLIIQGQAVVDQWIDDEGPAQVSRAAFRDAVRALGWAGETLADELDELAEHVRPGSSA